MTKALTRYAQATREPYVAALLVFPVYFIYQIGLSLTPDIRNGADLITDLLVMLRHWRAEALWGLAATLIIGYAVLLWRMRQKKKFSATLFGLVTLEGALQGMVMFFLVNQVMSALLLGGGGDYPFHVDIILSLGAGFHEELVFRVLMFGGIIFVGRKVSKNKTDGLWLILTAGVVSSLIFSAVHYVGPLGDQIQVGSFVFRFLAGCYFATIYRLRGFAVAVYTHAMYDIGVFAMT